MDTDYTLPCATHRLPLNYKYTTSKGKHTQCPRSLLVSLPKSYLLPEFTAGPNDIPQSHKDLASADLQKGAGILSAEWPLPRMKNPRGFRGNPGMGPCCSLCPATIKLPWLHCGLSLIDSGLYFATCLLFLPSACPESLLCSPVTWHLQAAPSCHLFPVAPRAC